MIVYTKTFGLIAVYMRCLAEVMQEREGDKSGLGKLHSIDTKVETKPSIKCEQCKDGIKTSIKYEQCKDGRKTSIKCEHCKDGIKTSIKCEQCKDGIKTSTKYEQCKD